MNMHAEHGLMCGFLLCATPMATVAWGQANQGPRHSETIKHVSHAPWEALSQKKIFFGHQSVGGNLITGMATIVREQDSVHFPLRIVEITRPEEFGAEPIFAHAWLGQNAFPESKIKAFADFIRGGIGNKADIAFFKFCYIDFSANTDTSEIFGKYRNAMFDLRRGFPRTTFVHVTVPLVEQRSGTKDLVKALLGRSIKDVDANVKRNVFNALLRKEYSGTEPLFDLAQVESSYLDGKRETFERDGKVYEALIPDYTDDGGHLNKKGSQLAVSNLLLYLMTLEK